MTAKSTDQRRDRTSLLPTALTDRTSRVPVMIGVALVAVGIALVWLAWARTAGTTDLQEQVAMAVGIGGLGLGITHVGTALCIGAVVRRDAALRDIAVERLRRQLDRGSEAPR